MATRVGDPTKQYIPFPYLASPEFGSLYWRKVSGVVDGSGNLTCNFGTDQGKNWWYAWLVYTGAGTPAAIVGIATPRYVNGTYIPDNNHQQSIPLLVDNTQPTPINLTNLDDTQNVQIVVSGLLADTGEEYTLFIGTDYNGASC